MKNRTFIGFIFFAALVIAGCSKDSPMGDDPTQASDVNLKKATQGANQLDGVGYFDATGECDTEGEGASYSLTMTGDLEGCLYTYVDEYDCTPGGVYMEIGREYFVGTYNGVSGTFWTTYRFEAKYEGCAEDGSFIGAEIKGRCQHPITEGTGTGVFEGVSGRLDMKDEIHAAGINYIYRGHLKYLNL